MFLPKIEPMLHWAKNNFKANRELRNYWEWRSWGSKYRNHGQYNGKKPKWRKFRKQEKRFKELQLRILADEGDEFINYMIAYNLTAL